MATMKALVIHEAGGAEVLKLEQIPFPTPQNGQVLIRVKAFGLNRSEMFTRQGHSPNVKFPRILALEQLVLSRMRQVMSSAKAMLSQPQWVALDEYWTVAMRNIRAYPQHKLKSSRLE